MQRTGDMVTTARKKGYLLGCAALLALLLGFVVWWSRNPIVFMAPDGAFPEVTARQLEDPSGTAVIVELELSGETTGYRITEVSVSRELAETLGLSAPEGFKKELLPLESDDLNDPETVEFVEGWNAENLRWTGDLGIVPATPIVLRIPASEPLAESGPLTISYERSGTLGGHWSSTQLELNEAQSGESARPQ